MAISASLHRNILLLNQLVPPSDDFKKVFREVISLLFCFIYTTILHIKQFYIIIICIMY
jgi:hypothetical protein